MTQALRPQWAGSQLHPSDATSFGRPLPTPRIQFGSFASQGSNYSLDPSSKAVQSTNRTDGFPPETHSCPSNLIPLGAGMEVVHVGPAEPECLIHFSHLSTNRLPSIPVRRDPKRQPTDGTARWKRREKASGAICLPLSLPVKVTVSGWGQDSNLEHQLDNSYWNDRVFDMCEIIGHDLKVYPDYDHGKPGKFEASHVEKQLLAYVFFRHHYQMSVTAAVSHEMDWVQTFEDLGAKNEVTIYVDQEVCKDCMQCRRAFIEKTAIQVCIYVGGKLWVA